MKKLLLFFFFCMTASIISAENISAYGESIDVEPPRSSMLIHGNTLYMTFGKQVVSFDISDPVQPKLLDRKKIGFFPQGLALNHDASRLFVVDGRYLSVLDITEPDKLKLRIRYLVNADPGYGPVDAAYLNGELYLACRNGGIWKGVTDPQKRKQIRTGWARDLTVLADGSIVCAADFGLKTGTPRKVRQLPDGRLIIANGFAGLAVVSGGKVCAAKDLNCFSSYGSHVYDAVSGMTEDIVLLAAGEIGVIAADISNPEQICYLGNAHIWTNVTGLVRKGKYLYVCDTTKGLAVFDVCSAGSGQIKQAGEAAIPTGKD